MEESVAGMLSLVMPIHSLEVWTDNGRAIALYAGAGFEVEGLRRDHYRRRDGRLRSTLIMAWRVG